MTPPLKVLLFSTDNTLVQLVTNCLEGVGYKVTAISQGIGAIEMILADKPTLVILDLDLPGFNSLAIIRALRTEDHNGRIPVILTGATMRAEDVLIGLEVGADLCLTETFHPQVFLARVRSLLRRTETRKDI